MITLSVPRDGIGSGGMRVELLDPRFDANLTGKVVVTVAVTGGSPAAVRARLGTSTIALSPAGEPTGTTHVGTLDTRALGDGAYTLLVEAESAARASGSDDPPAAMPRAFIDVMVSNAPEAWVTRKDADFAIDGQPFHYSGFNAYDLPFKVDRTLTARETTLQFDTDGTALVSVLEAGTILGAAAQVDRELMEAAKLGLSVVRTWAFNSDLRDAHAFYTPDWGFNEAQFQRLDHVVDSARRHGLKVILTLENYWSDYGGIAATAARFGLSKLEFFTDARCLEMYRAHVAHLVARVNTVNGRVYREDPTVFAWELMNEPRMDINDDRTPGHRLFDPTGARLGAWLSHMATYVKGLDPRHLVSPGSEGHGLAGWGATTEGYGDDPLAVMDKPDIDFFTFHPYLNEPWARFTVGAAKALVADFVKAGVARRKPVVMEEWGVSKNQPVLDLGGEPILPGAPDHHRVRAVWYKLVLATLRREGGAGSNVWMLQTNLQEPNFGISLFMPHDAVVADRGLASTLASEAKLMRLLGCASPFPDVERQRTDWSGYIHEVTHSGLMPPRPDGTFAPAESALTGDLLDILTRLGAAPTPTPTPTPGMGERASELTMQHAADILAAGLRLPSRGADLVVTLHKLDLLPRDVRGHFNPGDPLTRGELAGLAIRVDDFLRHR